MLPTTTTVNLEALLSNEFVVLALDALLHVSSVFVLGIVVVLACKLLTKAHVDAKLFTGLTIAVLLVILRIFLLNNAHYLGPVDILIVMVLVALVLVLTTFLLVYKLMAMPVFGSTLSAITIVAAQLALAQYTPILSLKLMPEGQRFAEYAGVANERTKQLMDEAQALQTQGDGIKAILQRALASLAFFTSDKEQEILAKDFSQGVDFLRERKAFMDSMSEEELAEYRAAMSQFLQEQGLAGAESRYSLSNLKNAKPEDLENLANFMKDMNKEYGFTEELPSEGGDDDLPPTAESLRQITENFRKLNLSPDKNEELIGRLSEFFGDGAFEAEFEKVRGQISDLKANSGQLMETVRKVDLEGMAQSLESASGQRSGLGKINLNPDVPSYPKYQDLPDDRGERVAVDISGLRPTMGGGGSSFAARPFQSSNDQSIDKELMDLVIYQETGYYPTHTSTDGGTNSSATEQPNSHKSAPQEWSSGDLSSRIASLGTANTIAAEENPPETAFTTGPQSSFTLAPERPPTDNKAITEVSYYMPAPKISDFPDRPLPVVRKPVSEPTTQPEIVWDVDSDYFPDSALEPKLTEGYVLRAPVSPDEAGLWNEVAKTIRVDAWFEGTSAENKGTIFVDGIAYRSGDTIERNHNGETYLFRFDGVLKGQVVISSLKREAI